MTARLSPRQQQIAELVLRGLSNKAIAEELGLTEGSVEQFLHRINQRLGGARKPRCRILQWWYSHEARLSR